MEKKIKTAIVGFGLSGHKLISPFIHHDERFELKKVMQRSKNTASQVYPYVEVVNDYKEIINDDAIDLVFITSPNEFHFDQAKKALEAGKHIVIEKPLTPTVEEADELIKIAGQKERVMSVYHNRRWDSNFLTVKKVVEAKLLGRLVEYEAHFDRYDPLVPADSWRDTAGPAAGVFFDLGPHLIDQALQLFGKPNAVWADIRTQRDNSEVDDAFDLQLVYQDIKVMLKAGKFIREEGPHYILHGTDGSFIKYGRDTQEDDLLNELSPFDEAFGKDQPSNWGILNTRMKGMHFYGHIETETGSWKSFFSNIYEAIADGRPLIVKPDEAKQSIQIIHKAFESSQKKTVVNL